MQDRKQAPVKIRTGNKTGIWLALLAALSMHIIIVFLPLNRQLTVPEPAGTRIEVQLSTFSSPPEPQQTEMEAEPPVAEVKPEPQPPRPQPPVIASVPKTEDLNARLETIDQLERRKLTNSILTRQFITEESVTDKIFGREVLQQPSEFQKEFHYPVRQSMIAMLDQPMQELPFAYTPGLIHFAYDPGVKGDLQRFWDVITPEFGWRTKYGTEVRCIWMLVIVGCGWK
jgi:hypothetical protein